MKGLRCGFGLALFLVGAAPVMADDGEYRDASPYAASVPGNAFFDASQYSQDCSNTAYYQGYTLVGFEGLSSGSTQRVAACKIINAPVVDMSFLEKLTAQGYTFNITYPFKDFGNGRAEIYWMKPCWPGLPQEIGNLNCYHGMARLTGAGWINKFAPVTTTVRTAEGVMMPTTMPYGSTIGGYVAAWPEPGRDVGFVYTRYGYNIEPPHVPSLSSYAAAALDDWLAGAEPPVQQPPLPAPPTVANRGANSINVGQSGTAAGFGSASSVNAAGQGSAAFDVLAYCSSPDGSGRARSQAWIRGCMSNMSQ